MAVFRGKLGEAKRALKRWNLERKVASYFAGHPAESINAEALAERLKQGPGEVSETLLRMLELGLVVSKNYPGEVRFSLNVEHPAIAKRAVRLVGNEWRTTLRDHLVLVRGVQRVLIYGSIEENRGESPLPLQLLVVGAVNKVALETAVRNAEDQLKRPIELQAITVEEHQRRLSLGDRRLKDIYSGQHESIIDRMDLD